MHVGSAVVLLLLLCAGCVRHEPHTPGPDSQAAVKRPAATASAEPAPPPAARPTASAAPRPAAEPAPSPPQPAATPTPAAAPEPAATPTVPSPQKRVGTPPAPTPPTVAKPAAPTSPEPAAKPTPSAPSRPEPAVPPASSPTNAAPPAAPKADSPVTTKPAATPTLDLDALKEEVRSTSAIGFFTKITLKNQVDDLLDDFRAYHQGKAKLTTIELRRSYDLLLMKVLSLLQDKDPRLAFSIVSSREAIWNLLVDRKKFATLQG
jgi:hypothetical protein